MLSSVNLLACSVHSGSYRSSKTTLCRKYGVQTPISAQLSLICQKAQFSRSIWQELNSRHICCGKHPALVMAEHAEQLNLLYVKFSMGKSTSYRCCCCSTESRDLGGNCQRTKQPNFHRVGTQTYLSGFLIKGMCWAEGIDLGWFLNTVRET